MMADTDTDIYRDALELHALVLELMGPRKMASWVASLNAINEAGTDRIWWILDNKLNEIMEDEKWQS